MRGQAAGRHPSGVMDGCSICSGRDVVTIRRMPERPSRFDSEHLRQRNYGRYETNDRRPGASLTAASEVVEQPFAANGAFWNENQPGFRFSRAPIGSREFFAEVEAHRYGLEPHIPDIVRFDQWAGRNVLEIGCGIATDGIAFARAGAHYCGLDANERPLELARRRFALEGIDCPFMSAPATCLPFSDEAFDLVYSHGVLHHIDETEVAIDEIYRVLRPGGTALVMLYHRGSFNYRFTIMTLRRLLAPALASRRAIDLVSRLTGEERAVLEGHRELLKKYGVRYLTDKQLFLSNNTDGPGNSLSKVYSRSEAKRLFRNYVGVHTSTRFLNLRVFPGGSWLARTALARRLERRIGWHLYVRAGKPKTSGAETRRQKSVATTLG
jgi:SAM-dependent methyltransferase